MIKNLNKIIAVVGPTASGKTSYAIELAKQIDGEIISADSRLVYKDFDIGTAKPTIQEQNGVPHHLIDIIEPDKEYSVGLYVNDAKNCINDILKRGKTPIICGGTGLYINALLLNYDLPKVPPNYELREKLKNKDNLYEILLSIDSETALKIDKNDHKKIIRAIEVIKDTDHKISKSVKESEYKIEWIGRNYERNELYERINKRVDIMLEKGLIDETKFLLNKYGRINNIIYTIGYQEITTYLDKKLELGEAIDKLKQNTRNYAKRQLTWFRKNENIKWNIYPKILKK